MLAGFIPSPCPISPSSSSPRLVPPTAANHVPVSCDLDGAQSTGVDGCFMLALSPKRKTRSPPKEKGGASASSGPGTDVRRG